MKEHVRNKHSEVELLKREEYSCDHCSFKSVYLRNMKRHVENKHFCNREVKWYQCEKCPFKTKLKKSLESHVQNNHFSDNDVKWISTVMML